MVLPLDLKGTYIFSHSKLIEIRAAAQTPEDETMCDAFERSAELVRHPAWFATFHQTSTPPADADKVDTLIVYYADRRTLRTSVDVTLFHPSEEIKAALHAVSTTVDDFLGRLEAAGCLWPEWACRVSAVNESVGHGGIRYNVYVLCAVDTYGNLYPPHVHEPDFFATNFPHWGPLYPDRSMQGDMMRYNGEAHMQYMGQDGSAEKYLVFKKLQLRAPNLATLDVRSFSKIRLAHWQDLNRLFRGPTYGDPVSPGLVGMVSHELWRLSRTEPFEDTPLTMACMTLFGQYLSFKNFYSGDAAARGRRRQRAVSANILQIEAAMEGAAGADDDREEDDDEPQPPLVRRKISAPMLTSNQWPEPSELHQRERSAPPAHETIQLHGSFALSMGNDPFVGVGDLYNDDANPVSPVNPSAELFSPAGSTLEALYALPEPLSLPLDVPPKVVPVVKTATTAPRSSETFWLMQAGPPSREGCVPVPTGLYFFPHLGPPSREGCVEPTSDTYEPPSREGCVEPYAVSAMEFGSLPTQA